MTLIHSITCYYCNILPLVVSSLSFTVSFGSRISVDYFHKPFYHFVETLTLFMRCSSEHGELFVTFILKSLSDKCFIKIGSGDLSCSFICNIFPFTSFPLMLCVGFCTVDKQPPLLIWRDWFCVGDKSHQSASQGHGCLSNLCDCQATVFVLSGFQ